MSLSPVTLAASKNYSDLRGWPVERFGAKGDGTTDDTAAVQAALDAVNDAGGGSIIFSPGKVYAFESANTIYRNTTVIAYGATLLRTGDEGVRFINGTADVDEYGGEGNIAWLGGLLDANELGSSFPSQILFGHAENILFRDMEFANLPLGHMIEWNSIKNGRIINCRFRDYGSAGESATEMLQLDGAFNSGVFPAFGNYDDTPCRDILIDGCTFERGKTAIGSHTWADGVQHTGIVIRDCLFDTMTAYGVHARGWAQARIEGCRFLNCVDGVRAGDASSTQRIDDLTIRGNTFRDIGQIAVRLLSSTGNNMANVDVLENDIDTTGNNAIQSDSLPATNIRINRNRVRNVTGRGIYIRNAVGFEVCDNDVAGCSGDDIQVGPDAATGRAASGRVSGNRTEGLLDVVGCENSLVTGNRAGSLNFSGTFSSNVAIKNNWINDAFVADGVPA